MLTFAAAILFLFVTPGPGVLTLAGVGSAYGLRPGLNYGLGLFAGSNAVMVAAAVGLAALFLADERLRLVFIVLSTAYLVYLAARIAFAGSKIAFIEASRPPGFWGGIALQIVNPKAYAVGTFVFSNFPLLPSNVVSEVFLKLLVLNAIWIPIHLLWLSAGVGIHRLDLSHGVQRSINVAMALSMLVVVGLAVWSTMFAS